MGLWVRVRGLAVAGLVLGGVFVGLRAASVATAGFAVAQTASSIVVEGNRRVESDTIRSYFRPARASGSTPSRSTKASRRCSRPACSQDVRPTWRAAA